MLFDSPAIQAMAPKATRIDLLSFSTPRIESLSCHLVGIFCVLFCLVCRRTVDAAYQGGICTDQGSNCMTRFGYLLESARRGYWRNGFEREAREFAVRNLARYQRHLSDARGQNKMRATEQPAP
jgi:hypothetical protein